MVRQGFGCPQVEIGGPCSVLTNHFHSGWWFDINTTSKWHVSHDILVTAMSQHGHLSVSNKIKIMSPVSFPRTWWRSLNAWVHINILLSFMWKLYRLYTNEKTQTHVLFWVQSLDGSKGTLLGGPVSWELLTELLKCKLDRRYSSDLKSNICILMDVKNG